MFYIIRLCLQIFAVDSKVRVCELCKAFHIGTRKGLLEARYRINVRYSMRDTCYREAVMND